MQLLPKRRFYFEEPDEVKRAEAVWVEMDNAFSIPILNSEFDSDYAPTQIIAELIKSLGYDGIAYKSSLADGCNVALFDLEAASMSNGYIYKVTRVSFGFDEEHNQFTQCC